MKYKIKDPRLHDCLAYIVGEEEVQSVIDRIASDELGAFIVDAELDDGTYVEAIDKDSLIPITETVKTVFEWHPVNLVPYDPEKHAEQVGNCDKPPEEVWEGEFPEEFFEVIVLLNDGRTAVTYVDSDEFGCRYFDNFDDEVVAWAYPNPPDFGSEPEHVRETQTVWHKYPDEKPDEEGFYLTTFRDGRVHRSGFSDGDWCSFEKQVIAWAELPEPYKPEE